jgi:hypothetical protein
MASVTYIVSGSLPAKFVPYGTAPFAYFDAMRRHWIYYILGDFGTKDSFRRRLFDYHDPWGMPDVIETLIPVLHGSLVPAEGVLWTFDTTDRGVLWQAVPGVAVPKPTLLDMEGKAEVRDAFDTLPMPLTPEQHYARPVVNPKLSKPDVPISTKLRWMYNSVILRRNGQVA